MKKKIDNLTEKMKEKFFKYSLALILGKGTASCIALSRVVKVTHDFLYYFLCKTDLFIKIFPNLMLHLAKHHSKKKLGWFIIDDTPIVKPFARFIEGLDWVFDTCFNRPEKGLCSIVLAWTNGEVVIPLRFEWYFSKAVAQNKYQTKSDLAVKLLLEVKSKIKYLFFLADAHYSTKKMLLFLCENKIPFVCKFTRTRVVISKEQNIKNQLKKQLQLKLVKNQRNSKMKGTFAGKELYFSVHKRKNKQGEYTLSFLISNINCKANEYLQMYVGRWCIEVMFRTFKKSLGVQKCSSRNIDNQRVHLYSVFFAYGFLQHEKTRKKLENPEGAIRYLSELKLGLAYQRIKAIGENFLCVA